MSWLCPLLEKWLPKVVCHAVLVAARPIPCYVYTVMTVPDVTPGTEVGGLGLAKGAEVPDELEPMLRAMLKGTPVLMWATLTPPLPGMPGVPHDRHKAQGLLCCDHMGTSYLV